MWTVRGSQANSTLNIAAAQIESAQSFLRAADLLSQSWKSPNADTYREESCQLNKEAELLVDRVQTLRKLTSELFSEIPF